MAGIQFTPAELGKNYVKWRKDLLTIPVESFRAQLGKLFSIHTGVRYQEKVGILDGNMQLGPYDPNRTDTESLTITARTLEVFLGSAVKTFDANTAIQSIWDDYVAKGDKVKSIPFVKYVAGYLVGKISENLAEHVWDGVRNPSGTTSADLFDGIETIINKEIAGGAISVANGNLVGIEDTSAVGADVEAIFKAFFRSANRKLRAQKTFLVCSEDEYLRYCDSYQENHGALPYNQSYEKNTLEGTQGRCTIFPVPFVADNFLKLVPAGNFIFGTNINGEETNMLIEPNKSSHFLTDFVATMFAGFQVQRVEKEFLHVGKVLESPEPEPEPEKQAAGIAYATAAVVKSVGDSKFTNALTNPNSLTGIVYSLENNTATGTTIDSATGEVTLGSAAGTATVKATFAGNDEYEAGTATYALTVEE